MRRDPRAAFEAPASIDHLVAATAARGVYEADLRSGISRFRWVEYSFSATIMVILIGFDSGIINITAVIAIAVQIVGSETVPGFVYRIVIMQHVTFFIFGLNQWLQYRGVGRWTDDVFGEKVCLALSLVAKSLLPWQIYFPSLDA